MRKLKWRHNDVITGHLIFIKLKHKSTKGISKQHTNFWSGIRELRSNSKVGKLTENCEGKMDITYWGLWPKVTNWWTWVKGQGHQFQYGPSQFSKQPFNKNCLQIIASVWLQFCSLTDKTDRHIHMHRRAIKHLNNFPFFIQVLLCRVMKVYRKILNGGNISTLRWCFSSVWLFVSLEELCLQGRLLSFYL